MSRSDLGGRALVYLGGMYWHGQRGTDRQMAERLAARVPLVYVEPPIVAWRRLRQPPPRPARLERLPGGAVRVSTIVPAGAARPLGRTLVDFATSASIRSGLRAIGHDVAAATIVSSQARPVSRVGLGRIVRYATDDYVAGAALMRLSRRWQERRAAALLNDADIVVAVSQELAAGLAPGCKVPVRCVPNGVDAAHFSAVASEPFPTDVVLRPPIVGFVGYVSRRMDTGILRALADSGLSLLLVGALSAEAPPPGWAQIVAAPNVQWVGTQPYEALPRYLRAMDVGITPYADTAFNRASFPLKTLEYLAAGLPVVSTDLPSARGLGADVMRVQGGPEQFVAQVKVALAAGDRQGDRRRRQALAAQHSWDQRAEELLAACLEDLATDPRVR